MISAHAQITSARAKQPRARKLPLRGQNTLSCVTASRKRFLRSRSNLILPIWEREPRQGGLSCDWPFLKRDIWLTALLTQPSSHSMAETQKTTVSGQVPSGKKPLAEFGHLWWTKTGKKPLAEFGHLWWTKNYGLCKISSTYVSEKYVSVAKLCIV